MKILYDHQIFSTQVYGGISRYFFELMTSFAGDNGITTSLPLCYSSNAYLADASFLGHKNYFAGRRFRGKTTLLKALTYANDLYARWSQSHGSYDLFHPTYYDPYFLNHIGNKPYVVTVYDMTYELFPEMCPVDEVTRWKRESVASAARIIAISESTKRDLIDVYGIDADRISVTYLASSLQVAGAVSVPFPLPRKYLLFVGQRGGYKNFNFFVESIAPLFRRDPELALVCTGGGAFSAAERELLDRLGMGARVTQHSVSDQVLAALYRGAQAFVFPSLYEGFGIPVLEAFNCGCPAILSSTSSLPEVGGEAARYFDPSDDSSIRGAVEELLGDRAARAELVRLGLERARDFSWEKTAGETKAIYQSVLEQ